MLSLRRYETSIIKRVIAKAPIQADVAIPRLTKREEGKFIPKAENHITKNATPSPAPELMPRMYGSAKGFLKRVCIWRPQMERATPAIIAVISLGILNEKMISET